MELARSIVARVRQYVGDRRQSKRRKVRLSFSVTVGPAKNLNGSSPIRSLEGHTLDISPNGMSLIVPAIRIGEHHLVGENRELKLKLELPDGPVSMSVMPVRYESLEDHTSETGFLIGVKIVDASESDRLKFDDYLAGLPAK